MFESQTMRLSLVVITIDFKFIDSPKSGIRGVTPKLSEKKFLQNLKMIEDNIRRLKKHCITFILLLLLIYYNKALHGEIFAVLCVICEKKK